MHIVSDISKILVLSQESPIIIKALETNKNLSSLLVKDLRFSHIETTSLSNSI